MGEITNNTEEMAPMPTPKCKYAVSDNSVHNDSGTFGWVTATNTQVVKRHNRHVTGISGTLNSFRAEAQGLADIIYTGNVDQTTKIFLDNTSVIDKVNQKVPTTPYANGVGSTRTNQENSPTATFKSQA